VVNGALFHWFGPDLITLRISIVVLKTIAIALTYLITRHLASRRFALLVCGVLVSVWGTPWWFLNTPYANHYSLTLTLAGVLCFLSLPHRFRLACLLAGLSFGLAATFKPTAGGLAFAGFALFLVLADEALARRALPTGPSLPAWCVRGARLTALAGALALFAGYLWHRNTVWNVVVLFTPAALTLCVATIRELRAPVHDGMRAGLLGIVLAASGAALPLLGIGVYYAAKGWLADLLFNVIAGLPQAVAATYYHPFSAPTSGVALRFAILAATVALIAVARRHLRLPAPGRFHVAVGLGVVGAVLLLFAARSSLPATVLAYARSRAWYGSLLSIWYAVPLVSIWLTGLLLFRSRSSEAAAGAEHRTGVLLVYCNAVAAWLLLYPVADLVHIIMGLPAVTPLWAFLLERFHRAGAHVAESRPYGSRWISMGLTGTLAVCMIAPAIDHLVLKFQRSRDDLVALNRATGIRGTQPKFGEVAALVGYLRAEAPAQRDLFVLSGEQLLYFLADRRSVFEAREFTFYLLLSGQLSDDDARRLVDEQRLVEKLAAAQPVIVEGGDARTAGRLRRVFPSMSRYLDSHYHIVARLGDYRVLVSEGDRPGSVDPHYPLP
jgi:hypothetical protein